MKMSGANPSQPPEPIVCRANKSTMLMNPESVSARIDHDHAHWRALAPCNLPQDFSLPQAGDVSASGMNWGPKL